MTTQLTRRDMALAAAGSLALLHPFARAESPEAWPSHPIRMVVPGGAGSGTDMLARALVDRLSPVLHQPFVIDNKPGASGVIGTLAVTRAAPDGYTLLYTNASSTVMAEALIPNLPFSTLRDLVPVALNGVGGVLLIVNSQLAPKNLPELVDFIQKHPDKYPYGSWGVGSNGHLTMEWLKQRTGIKTVHVPYKTAGALLTDLVSGVISIGWMDLSSPLPFIQQGKLRAIAINGDQRNPQLPDLHTMTEQGYPFSALGFQGIFAPVGTPAAIVQRLNTEVNKVLATPEYQATLRRLNIATPPALTPTQFRDLVESNLKIWKKVTTDAHIQLEG